MQRFPTGHATHPRARVAALMALAQLRAQMRLPGYAAAPTLGLLYITDHYADQAQDLLDLLAAELPEITDWSGTVGVGVCGGSVEYFDQPALALMLLDVPCDQYRVFSGVAPLPRSSAGGFAAHTALVHADGGTPEVAKLVAELAGRTASGYLFGGLSASRGASVQFAVGGNGNLAGQGAAGGVFAGGLSGVAFGPGVALVSRVTQGCQPVGRVQRITAAAGNLVLELDGAPALESLLDTLDVSLAGDPQQAIERVRATLAGLMDDERALAGTAHTRRTGHFGAETRVRHIIGLDGQRHGVALADHVEPGMRLAFCQRNVQAARADLTRICAEIREELAPADRPEARRIAGALYVSCSGRGGPHFGGDSAELRIVQHALGDVPLAGFFAGGEIAHASLHGYTGVLTVFLADE
jgi:small ligand-binding sensory domain FIST